MRAGAVETWPVVNDRLVRLPASERESSSPSWPPPPKMFATRQSTMRRRKKKKGVRRGAAAAATLLCWSPVATIATRQHCGANDCLEGNFRTMRVHTQTQGRHWKQHTNTYSNIPNASSRFFVLCVLFFFPFEMGKKKAGNG